MKGPQRREEGRGRDAGGAECAEAQERGWGPAGHVQRGWPSEERALGRAGLPADPARHLCLHLPASAGAWEQARPRGSDKHHPFRTRACSLDWPGGQSGVTSPPVAAEAWKRALQGAPCHMDTSFGPRGSVCIHRAVFLGPLPPKSSQVACQGGVPVPGVAIAAADRPVAVALSTATPGGREADTRGPVWEAPPPGSPAASPWRIHLPDSPVSARYELISSLVVLLPGLPCPRPGPRSRVRLTEALAGKLLLRVSSGAGPGQSGGQCPARACP